MDKAAREANKGLLTSNRALYMSGEWTHAQYYGWLADLLGVREKDIPASIAEVREALKTDEHLNNIPLNLWDRRDALMRPRAYSAGLPWSLSDTVCTLKARAKQLAEAVPA